MTAFRIYSPEELDTDGYPFEADPPYSHPECCNPTCPHPDLCEPGCIDRQADAKEADPR